MAISGLDLSGTSAPRVFALVAGDAGIGKTSLLLNFPKGTILYVSAEKGELSVQGSGYDAVSIDTLDDMFELIGMINDSGFKYILIDSLSELYDKISDDSKAHFTPAQNFAKHDNIKYWFMQAIKAYRNLDRDVIFLCHTKEEKNGMALEKELAFQGQMPSLVRKQFDLCINYDFVKIDGKDTRKFITSPQLSKMAKARVSPYLNIEIDDLEEPNLFELVKKLKGEK